MKKYFLLINVLLYLIKVNAQVVFTSSNLPIVVINTNNQTIVDEPRIMCNMGIIWNGPGITNNITDPYNNYNGKIAIEIRGSTSQQYPKKSYGFETVDNSGNKKNVSLLTMPKENDWILYGAYPDKTLMRNEITYDLFGKMQPWSPRFVYCELVINGQYKGVYSLMEKIKRDYNRVNIAKLDSNGNISGGYIIKIDKLTGGSSTTWTSPYQTKLKFLYHDPEYAELNANERNYIKNYITNFENAVYGPNFKDSVQGYRAFINTGSFIDFMLMQELGRTVDGYRSSSFMYKDNDSKGGKLTCGPMWDFNLSYGNADYCSAYDTTGWQYNFANVCPSFTTEPPEWWERLLEDTTFANEVQCRWLHLRSTILKTTYVNHWIDSVAILLEDAQQRNFVQWPILGVYVNWNYFVGNTYKEGINYLKWWFQSRSEYMDYYLPGNCTLPNSISAIKNNEIPLSVFPNPTSGLLFTNTPPQTEVKIYSIDGKQIPFKMQGSIINISDLDNGYYILIIESKIFKIIKQ